VSTVRIRPAQPGDGEAIARQSRESAEYYRRLAPEDFRMPDREGQAEWLDSFLPTDGETEIALVAEIDGEFAGYLEARLEEPLESARYQTNPELGERRLFINALGTARSHWRRGVGSALVEAAEQWGRDHGAAIAVMDTYAQSPVSLPFWRGRGYRTRAVVMRKRLD
jgi:GNAT superfamily N-acetyltransferase